MADIDVYARRVPRQDAGVVLAVLAAVSLPPPMVGKLMTELIEAVGAGQDHDTDPVKIRAVRTGNEINMAAFSRKRLFNADNTGTVMG